MGEILNINHESGTLNDYATKTETSGGNVVANSASKLIGTNFGMEVTIDGTNNPGASGNPVITYSGTELRYRFYINVASLTVPNATSFVFGGIVSSVDSKQHIRFILGRDDSYGSGGIYLTAGLRDDDDSWTANNGGETGQARSLITVGQTHLIEVYAKKATDNGSVNAQLKYYIDGNQIRRENDSEINDVDLYDDWGWESLFVGVVGGAVTDDLATIYVDELIVNDDGSEIGPVTFSDGNRSRYSGADYNIGLRSRYGPYNGRYR